MINGKMPYRRTLSLIKVGAGNEYIFDEQVQPGWVICYTHIAFIDNTTDLTQVLIGCRRRSLDHWWEEEVAPQAGQLYWTNEEYWLTEGERLTVRFDGGLAADDIWVYAEGLLYENPSEVGA